MLRRSEAPEGEGSSGSAGEPSPFHPIGATSQPGRKARERTEGCPEAPFFVFPVFAGHESNGVSENCSTTTMPFACMICTQHKHGTCFLPDAVLVHTLLQQHSLGLFA